MTIRSLYRVLSIARRNRRTVIMVDVKIRSPRDGELIADGQLEPYVKSLVDAGVDALSMPTDYTHFGGSVELARRVRALSPVPLMRKEFFTSVDQMDESLDAGFDAVQLSLGTIPDPILFDTMRARAEEIGLEVVVGVHGPEQLTRAIDIGARAIGLNNRDITALELDPGTVSASESLLPVVPEHVLVISESGMLSGVDVARASQAGADAVLIGTAMAKSDDPVGLLAELRQEAELCRG
ncbi:indole-3-glycerol-phosphate synthase [Pseudonocardia spinosispora]|uniref:indole-3-glycerol-phosphate synthase n=1 Tax=Pseudonocardia spinosispora TaxID=103441 RepID=UPI00146F95F5|nr:indole-3-glycerol-phosphate synthase [Pseudonocardia spinosispora]